MNEKKSINGGIGRKIRREIWKKKVKDHISWKETIIIKLLTEIKKRKVIIKSDKKILILCLWYLCTYS